MAKSVWVPSVAASATTSRAANDGVKQPPRSKPKRVGRSNGNGGDSGNKKNERENDVNADQEEEADASKAKAQKISPTTINFVDVHWELQKYMRKNDGSLSIPTTHPALMRIIDSLSESSGGIEVLSKKRWEDRLTALHEYQEERGDINVPMNHHSLGNWVLIQRRQYKLYEEGKPSALTKKRFGKLKAIGFGVDKGMDKKSVELSTHEDENFSRNEKVKVDETASQNCDIDKDIISNKNKKKEVKPKEENSEEDDRSIPLLPLNERRLNKETASQNCDIGKDIISNKNKKKAVKPKEENAEEEDRNMSPVPTNGRMSNTKVAKIKGKCDICEKSDGFWGHNLQKCKICHVLVHELCYGMVETDTKDPNFVCHACRAVGASVEVNVPSKIGGCGKKMGKKRETVIQQHRPRECLLCSHDKGNHAMHPLLDMHGSDGRQLVINRPCWKDGKKSKEKKLAWVHTLCANVICSNPGTASSVYGCDKNGNYYDDCVQEEEEEEEEFGEEEEDGSSVKDDGKEAKLVKHEDKEKEEELSGEESCIDTAISYFAISNESVWAKNIKEHRELKCFICGVVDKVWRIPVQCTAGDDNEIDRWKSRHKAGTRCYMAMHVGCARWGNSEREGSHLQRIDGNTCRMCYFTPGRYEGEDGDDAASRDSNDQEKTKTIVSCYCTEHARDIVLYNPNRKKKSDKSVPKVAMRGAAVRAVKTERRARSNAAIERELAHPKQNLSEHAQASLKKSLIGIRQKRGNIKKGTRKRKSDATNQAAGKFGAPESKKAKVKLTEVSAVQFPYQGRSASALGHGQPVRLMNSSATSASNRNHDPAPCILNTEERLANEMPDGQPNVKPAGILKMDPGVRNNDYPGQVSRKRKPGLARDPPTISGTGFKRIKIQD